MKTLMTNHVLGIAVVVPLLVAVCALEAFTALPTAAGRFIRTRRVFLWTSLALVVPFALVVAGRFVYLR